jgi:DNA-binding NtrC family response regulator
LFLDEIAELTAEAQVKLLRVIEEGTFSRVGGNKPVTVDVRVMAATNRDLASMVKEGKFREDLYWRLNVLSLSVCPLRERKEDIPMLVDHFLEKYAVPLRVGQPLVSDKAMELLMAYDWPGNVRELQNCIYSAITISDGLRVEPSDLPKRIYLDSKPSDSGKVTSGNVSLAEIATEATAKAEREAISRALLEAGGNREKAAESLGIGRQTLYRKLKLYGME